MKGFWSVLLVAAVVWLATGCKGKASNAQAEQVDGLYAVQANSQQVEAKAELSDW